MNMRSIALCCVLASAVSFPALAGSFSAGLNISEEVAPEKTGMRVYPGAALVVKKSGNDDSVNIQFAFGEYGLKVVVAKLRSADSTTKVAQFYRDELTQFGNVLDCSDASVVEATRAREKKSKALTCDREKSRKGAVIFKAGVKDDQHIVEIKPSGDGSEFSLVHVKVRSPE